MPRGLVAYPGQPPSDDSDQPPSIVDAIEDIDMSNVLSLARSHFHIANNLPWPKLLPIHREWQDRNRSNSMAIDGFTSAEEVILHAQDLGKSGFNHRGTANQGDILAKLVLFKTVFPDYDLRVSVLAESMFSKPESLYMWHGKPLSTIMFWHVHVALFCLQHFVQSPVSVLEIGAGCGELARYMKMLKPDLQYVIIDLPSSLFYAEVFLRKNFPDMELFYILTDDMDWPEGADFILIPVPYMDVVKTWYFDFAINQGSMQEMPGETVQGYIDFIQSLDCHGFYSLNYSGTLITFGTNWQETHRSNQQPRLVADCGVDRELCFKPVSDV